jgi:hypothetical protein
MVLHLAERVSILTLYIITTLLKIACHDQWPEHIFFTARCPTSDVLSRGNLITEVKRL